MALTELENRQWRIEDEPWPYRDGRSTTESVQFEQDLLAGRVYLEVTLNRSVTRVWLDADWDEDDRWATTARRLAKDLARAKMCLTRIRVW